MPFDQGPRRLREWVMHSKGTHKEKWFLWVLQLTDVQNSRNQPWSMNTAKRERRMNAPVTDTHIQETNNNNKTLPNKQTNYKTKTRAIESQKTEGVIFNLLHWVPHN